MSANDPSPSTAPSLRSSPPSSVPRPSLNFSLLEATQVLETVARSTETMCRLAQTSRAYLDTILPDAEKILQRVKDERAEVEKSRQEILEARKQREANLAEKIQLDDRQKRLEDENSKLTKAWNDHGERQVAFQAEKQQLEDDRKQLTASKETILREARAQADTVIKKANSDAEQIKSQAELDAWTGRSLAVPESLKTPEAKVWLAEVRASGILAQPIGMHFSNFLGVIATMEARCHDVPANEARTKPCGDLGRVLVMFYPIALEVAERMGRDALMRFVKLYAAGHRLGVKLLLPAPGDLFDRKIMNGAESLTHVRRVKCWGYAFADQEGVFRVAEVE